MSWAHLSPDHFLRAAEQFEPTILAQREAIERNRGLSPDLFHALRDGGFFSLWLPKALGGPELTPAELARVVEAISHADGSVGWLVGIGTSNSRLGGYLPELAAREIWGSGPIALAGALNPPGTAIVIPSGYRVTGSGRMRAASVTATGYSGRAAWSKTASRGCVLTASRISD